MPNLREAATQALEALEDMLGWQSLAPQTIQEAAKSRAADLRAALAEPVQQGCDHCNHPLYAAIKCRVCGRVTEPVQEPVAWIEHEWAGTGLRKLHFEKRDPTVRDEVVNPVWTPLYTAQPQRPAEPVQEPDSPERRCGGPGCDMTCCQPVAQRGAMFHTHPAVERQRSVEAAVRPACGVDPAAKAEPVQEPVHGIGGEG